MIGLVETLSLRGAGRLDDIDRIEEEHPNAHGVMLRRVVLKNGASFDTFAHEGSALMARPVQLLAAQPDASIIWHYTDEAGSHLEREPLIAWALCLDGEIRAVSPSGVKNPSKSEVFVEMPGKRIHSVGEHGDIAWFDDAAAMLEHFRAKASGKEAA